MCDSFRGTVSPRNPCPTNTRVARMAPASGRNVDGSSQKSCAWLGAVPAARTNTVASIRTLISLGPHGNALPPAAKLCQRDQSDHSPFARMNYVASAVIGWPSAEIDPSTPSLGGIVFAAARDSFRAPSTLPAGRSGTRSGGSPGSVIRSIGASWRKTEPLWSPATRCSASLSPAEQPLAGGPARGSPRPLPGFAHASADHDERGAGLDGLARRHLDLEDPAG